MNLRSGDPSNQLSPAEQRAAALARRLDTVRSTADKELATMHQVVEPLAKSSYHRFMKQLERQASRYEWPPHILSDSVPDLTPAQRNALDPDTVEGLRKIVGLISHCFYHASISSLVS